MSTATDHPLLTDLPDQLVLRQFYLGCLSQASYLIGDRAAGRAVVVDPRRDIDELLAAAQAEGLTIELVLETHFHADFLSGHLEVATATGATIGFGAAATTEFPARALHDGERLSLGGVELEIWETPGHTPESISILVRTDADAEPIAVLTGDTLFIGDVGRPDLLVAADIPAEQLGSQLFDSVHRLAELPEPTLVLPGHGAGSACGKSLSADTVSTIGAQRATNHALAPMSRARFIDVVTEGQSAAPGYFGYDARRNREAREVHDPTAPVRPLTLAEADAAIDAGAVLVDTRPAQAHAVGHLLGSLAISVNGRFAEQAGSLIRPGTPIVLIAAPAEAEEAQLRLARIGFDQVVGTISDLDAVLIANPDRSGRLSRLTVTELAERRETLGERLQFIDVRNPGEVEANPVAGATNLPLATLADHLDELDRTRPVVAICAGGARSAVASSLLRASGFTDVSDVLGGAGALGAGETCTVGPNP